MRLSYTDNDGSGAVAVSEIVEEANYYPFGLKHTGYNNLMPSIGNATAQKWKYNDREFEALHGFNMSEMDFRQYDPALGRFTGIDALAEYIPAINLYQFGFNNPIVFNDPTGLLPNGGDNDGGGDDPRNDGELPTITINADQSKPYYSGLGSIPHLTYYWGKPNHDGSPHRSGGGGDGGWFQRAWDWLTGGKKIKAIITVGDDDNAYVHTVFAGDKFETQMARNDINRGALDAAVYQQTYNQYANISSDIFIGFIPMGNLLNKPSKVFNFSVQASKHMSNPARAVPVQILREALNTSKGIADPRGSRALMYYTKITKNGRTYTLEILYDQITNSIWHFKYWVN